jgi:hypothetical protein
MARTPTQHSEDSTGAAYASWANTADRTVRLRNAHDNSPSGHNWHARRLFGADVDLDSLTKAQWKQVAAARRAWLKAQSIKATRVRKRNAAARRDEREAADMAAIEKAEAEVQAEMARIEAQAQAGGDDAT